jgi:hypothetical protein
LTRAGVARLLGAEVPVPNPFLTYTPRGTISKQSTTEVDVVREIRTTFGDCGGTCNGLCQREGPELYKYKFSGKWNSPERKKKRYNHENREEFVEGVKNRILANVPSYTFFHFVYENLHEFVFEKNSEGQVVMVQGWVGHFYSWEWFLPENFGNDHRQSTAMYNAPGKNAQEQDTEFMKGKKELYGRGQNLNTDGKLSDLLDALGSLLTYQTYADIPMNVWNALPFPPAVTRAIFARDALTFVGDEDDEVVVDKQSFPVNLDVAAFPVDITSLATLNERIEELRAQDRATRFISDVVLWDSYTRVMDAM